MSHAVVFGLAAICAGVLVLGLRRFVHGVAVRGYSRAVGTEDTDRYSSSLWRRMAVLAGVMLLVGVGFVIYGLLGGQLPRE